MLNDPLSVLQRLVLTSLCLVLWVSPVTANDTTQADVLSFANAQHESTYKSLIYELRCLVCQNQNIADSNAELAVQLRGKVYDMVAEGKTKEAIKAFMVERYGDFVLYKPPFQLNTLFLWLGPFLLLALGFVFLFRVLKTSRQKQPALDSAARDNIQHLLEDDQPQSKS